MATIDSQLRAVGDDGTGPSGDFTITYQRHVIRAAYRLDSEDYIVSFALTAGYDAEARARGDGPYRRGAPLVATRPLEIELRREGRADRAAKLEGVSAEWQSGDSTFDDAVYVASPTSDAQLLAAVLGPEVRAGVLELLGVGFEKVEIDVRDRVLATIGSRALNAIRAPDCAERALAAYARILRNLPVVAHSGEKHSATPLRGVTTVLGVIGAAGWLTNVGYAVLLLGLFRYFRRDEPHIPTDWYIGVPAFAILAGLVGAWLYTRVVRRCVRGRSTAHTEIATARLASFFGVSVVAFAVAFGLAYVLAPGWGAAQAPTATPAARATASGTRHAR